MNKCFGKILCVLFLVFLFSNAFALGNNSNCNLVELDAGMLSLGKSDEGNVRVSVHNYAGEPFYLETLNVVDDVSGMMFSAYLSDKIVLPGESKAFSVRVQTLEDVAFGRHSVSLQAKGHFFGGDVCGFNELKTELVVEVVEEEVKESREVKRSTSCEDFVLKVVDTVNIPKGEEISSFLLDIDNGLNERVEVRLAGEDLSLYSNFLSIPQNTHIQKRIYFTAKKDNAKLVIKPHCAACELNSKVVKIVKETGEEVSDEGEGETAGEEGFIALPGIGLITLGQAKLLAGAVLMVIAIAVIGYSAVTKNAGKGKKRLKRRKGKKLVKRKTRKK